MVAIIVTENTKTPHALLAFVSALCVITTLTDRALCHRLLSALTSRWYNERVTHAGQSRQDRSDLRSAPRDGTSIAHDPLIGRTTNRVHDTIDGTSACSQIERFVILGLAPDDKNNGAPEGAMPRKIEKASSKSYTSK